MWSGKQPSFQWVPGKITLKIPLINWFFLLENHRKSTVAGSPLLHH
jgi:hypothetical protein